MNVHRARITGIAAVYRARGIARRRMLAPLALMLAAACGGGSNPKAPALTTGDPVPNLDEGIARQWQARPAIVQSVRLLNPGLRTGDTLRIESTLRNVSDKPVDITHVVCEL